MGKTGEAAKGEGTAHEQERKLATVMMLKLGGSSCDDSGGNTGGRRGNLRNR